MSGQIFGKKVAGKCRGFGSLRGGVSNSSVSSSSSRVHQPTPPELCQGQGQSQNHSTKMEVTAVEANKKVVPFPNEALQHVLKFLGPKDLAACRNVSTAWREEVNDWAKNLKKYEVDSMEDLQEGLDLLRARSGPGRPPFIIQDLWLSIDEDFDIDLVNQFMRSISGPHLGKVAIVMDSYEPLEQFEIQEMLRRNPNVFKIYIFIDSETEAEYFDCSLMFWSPGRVPGALGYFPALRDLEIDENGASLATILRACPNLKRLDLYRLEAPYTTVNVDGSNLKYILIRFIDFSTCVQMRDLNLSLTEFNGFFNGDLRGMIDINNRETMVGLIQLFRQFLETQAPSLQELYLEYEGNVVLRNDSNVPCVLPHLDSTDYVPDALGLIVRTN